MFERSVCHLGNGFVGSRTVGLNDDRLVIALGGLQQWPELLHSDSLVLKINGRNCPAANADDLMAGLWTESKARERHRNRDALLQDEIRTEQEEENKEEGDVYQRDQHDPAKIKVDRSAEFHEHVSFKFLGVKWPGAAEC